MPFPIKFKLIHKETGKTFKQWAIENNKTNSAKYNDKYLLMPCLNMEGIPYYVNFENFYMSGNFLKVQEWDLYVATNKTEKGNWDYRKVTI
jgi:hypothetical protein